MASCIAPQCKGTASDPVKDPFCKRHAAAPAAQRGGWLSHHRRRLQMGKVAQPVIAPVARTPSSEIYDASNVAPRLWIGAKPPLDRSYPGIDLIVLCAGEYQPTEFRFYDNDLIHCPLPDDALNSLELGRAIIGGATVAGALKQGKRVLVTCQMGINRSALVGAFALWKLTRASADEIIALIRTKRDAKCLYNPHFREYLRKYVGDGRR